jgi:hypothetical protein
MTKKKHIDELIQYELDEKPSNISTNCIGQNQ